MQNIAVKAVGFKEALQPEFAGYIRQVVINAKCLATTSQKRGLSVVSGGTDIQLRACGLAFSHRPHRQGAEERLEAVVITVNKNTVPGEMRSPFTTSGIRVGTPALTTRGFTESVTEEVANYIVDLLYAPGKRPPRRGQPGGRRPRTGVPGLRLAAVVDSVFDSPLIGTGRAVRRTHVLLAVGQSTARDAV